MACEACAAERAEALRAVDRRVSPRACFLTRSARGGWGPIREGAEVHWVAHSVHSRVHARVATCLDGFPVRLEGLLWHRRELGRGVRPAAGDLWVDLDRTRCGVVHSVRTDPEHGIQIAIRRLCLERGGVAIDDFYRQLMGRGFFFR